MQTIRLYDGCFPNENSATLAGDCSGESPLNVEWCREDPCGSLYTWYTDTNLHRALKDSVPARIAWLIEPAALSLDHYKFAYQHRKLFKTIFTHNRFFSELGPPFEFYPLGGSWIDLEHWSVRDKYKLVSIIASEKKGSDGQSLRHLIARMYPHIDRFGKAFTPIDSKLTGLSPFRYSVIVESWRGDYYFSEKLIDCLSQGTVPIYWGCPSIGDFFNPDGIMQFDDMKELKHHLNRISIEDYESRLEAIRENFELAKMYRIAEDWLYKHHGRFFQ